MSVQCSATAVVSLSKGPYSHCCSIPSTNGDLSLISCMEMQIAVVPQENYTVGGALLGKINIAFAFVEILFLPLPASTFVATHISPCTILMGFTHYTPIATYFEILQCL